MLWQVFGQRMERGWKWAEGKKRIFLYSAVIKYVHPVSLNHVIFYCPQLDFISDRDSKCICWSAVTVLIPTIHQSQTKYWWNILLSRTDTNWYLLTLCSPSLKYRYRMKALNHQTQVVVLWLLQMLSSHSRCADNSQKASMRWWIGRQYEIKVILHINPVK